jgi:hypothetical protein
LLLGDSAGAYVLSSYFYDSPADENRGKIIKFYKGFVPRLKIITVAHTNNRVYTNPSLLEKVKNFAAKKDLKILTLKENREKRLKV